MTSPNAWRSSRATSRDVDALAKVAEGVDGVFHMAVLPLGPTIEQPRLGLEVNVVGTFNVLEAAQQAGAKKVVFSSASSVYGDTDETMDESHPLGARTMYGATKIAGEYLLRAFNDAVPARVRDASLHERLRAAAGRAGS